MEDTLIKLVGDLGGIGLATLLALILYKIVGNHLNHNTDAMNRLENAITRLTQFLEDREKLNK